MYSTHPEKTIAVSETLDPGTNYPHHHSDGTELIPAEVQAHTRHDLNQPVDPPLEEGYTIDDEGLINAYALEPTMYLSEPSSPDQQKSYVIQGVVALLIISLAVVVAFSVR